MKILYQRAAVTPSGWVEVDSSRWSELGSFKVNALNVQGVVFEGPDFYDVEELEGGVLRVVVWHDDPVDWPEGQRWAREVVFYPLAASIDPRLGGAINTRQQFDLFADVDVIEDFKRIYEGSSTRVRPWIEFDSDRPNARRGTWLSDALYAKHQRARAHRGWREWGEHLDPSELDARGHVKDQRAQRRYVVPRGTRTYYHNPEAGSGVQGADTTNTLALSPTTLTNLVSGNVGGTGTTSFEAVCPVDEPASAAWPTVGDYRYQLDVPLSGADLVFGLLPLGAQGLGGIERVDAAIANELQIISQDQAAFSGSGLFMASITDPAWTAGLISDRVGVVIAAQRVAGHGNQTFTLQVGESDDFIDGPWPSAASSASVAIFFGANF